MKNILTISNSDFYGVSGIQSDIMTFCENNTHPISVITAINIQNDIESLFEIPKDVIGGQIDDVFKNMVVEAVKIGMISKPEVVRSVAKRLVKYKPRHVVLDPVMLSTRDLSIELLRTVQRLLVPISCIVTVSLQQAQLLANMKIKRHDDIKVALKKIRALGTKNVLITEVACGGGLCDILFDGKDVHVFKTHIEKNIPIGIQSSISSAITANLAVGNGVVDSIINAKRYIEGASKNAFVLSENIDTMNHFLEFTRSYVYV